MLLLKSMEIVVHSKKSQLQQKFQKKLYHFNRNCQFRNYVKNDSMIQLDIRSRSRCQESDFTQKPPTPQPCFKCGLIIFLQHAFLMHTDFLNQQIDESDRKDEKNEENMKECSEIGEINELIPDINSKVRFALWSYVSR